MYIYIALIAQLLHRQAKNALRIAFLKTMLTNTKPSVVFQRLSFFLNLWDENGKIFVCVVSGDLNG